MNEGMGKELIAAIEARQRAEKWSDRLMFALFVALFFFGAAALTLIETRKQLEACRAACPNVKR